MMIKCAVVESQGRDLESGIQQLRVVSKPFEHNGLGPTSVLLDVKSCCVNYPDLMQTTNSYQHRVTFPYTPGLEFSGIVAEVGPACEHLKIGDKVMVMSKRGGLSTRLIVDESECLPLPGSLTLTQGACFRMGFETAYHALVERANLKTSDIVLVNGATGGMGLAAAQLAKKVFGCTVIVTGGCDHKLGIVKQVCDADVCINYKTEPSFSARVKQITGGRGVDVVFDPVGGEVFLQALKSTAFGARVLVVGFTSQAHVSIPANYVLIKCLSILGCRAGEMPARWPDGKKTLLVPRQQNLLAFASEGKLLPHVSHTFPFTTAGVQEAFRCLLRRDVVGRVCISIDSSTHPTQISKI